MLTWAMIALMNRSSEGVPGLFFLLAMIGDVTIAGLISNAACGGCMR